MTGLALFEILGGLDAKDTIARLYRCGQSDVLQISKFRISASGLDIGLATLVHIDLESDCRERVEHLLGGKHLDGRGVVMILLGLEPSPVLDIGAIELELLGNLSAELL